METFDSALTHDDGWTRRQERQATDSSYNLPGNLYFDAQGMHLVGRREAYRGLDYTIADALGQTAADDRAELLPRHHARLGPSAQGLWSGMWFRPANSSDGETDLMENFGGYTWFKSTLHNQYGDGHKTIGAILPWSKLPNPDPEAQHTYTIEKKPGSIKIWADGVLVMNATPASEPAGFDWNRIFENPARTWYPRPTFQIGYGEGTPASGLPVASFQQSQMLCTHLTLWRYRR